ncbi:MAG: hypothetical protein IT181_01780, partial [Acidobacteria bacterium]|nr:hypothetical protein [Acidobacteriota bacterium]
MRPPGLLRILAAAAAAAALLVPVAAWPQSHLRPGDPGVWKPWKGLTAIASVRADRALGAGQVKAFEAELLALNALLQRASGVAAPVGFS